ncbi:hypothetical protein KCU88_g430, partial [Aureobasidium melanogenum]
MVGIQKKRQRWWRCSRTTWALQSTINVWRGERREKEKSFQRAEWAAMYIFRTSRRSAVWMNHGDIHFPILVVAVGVVRALLQPHPITTLVEPLTVDTSMHWMLIKETIDMCINIKALFVTSHCDIV